jgi:two-component system CheB/CheR fusion protein
MKMETTATGRQTPDFPIVGIGASAGGIAPLRGLFKRLPERTGLAFVVVQHLLPEHPSQLAEVLQKSTALPVCEAENGMKVNPDHVYVAPPSKMLTLEQGALRCRPLYAEEHAGIDSIDTFFASLAADRGRQAIAVVLSGTGKDGAAGIIRIRQAGGIVFVQNPHTAQHDGMPLAAIATGAANHILPVETMAHELANTAFSPAVPAATAHPANEDIAPPLDDILTLIRRQTGFDLSGYKLKPLRWQIQQRMKIRRIEHIDDYEDLLHDDPAELEALIRDIPIHVTEFFRDPEAWEVLAREVIAPLVQTHGGDRPLRVWTPACSSGEEAYSVAMLLAEQASQAEKPVDFQLFATDASFEIVARASRGLFSAAAVETISPERKARFFYTADGAYRIKKSLREKLVFAPQHLLADPPFSDLDMVTCRNLLIYLEPSVQQRLLSLLHASLRMGGTLFLGSGESLPPKQRGFETVSMHWHIYRKTEAATDDIRMHIPKRLERLQHTKPGKASVAERAHWAALEGFELPSVLIDDKFNILRVYGDTDAFLRLPPGEPTLNLLQVAQPALVTNLWIAADRAVAERRAVTVGGGLLDSKTGNFSLSLRITPLSGEDGRSIRLLVSFLRSAPPAGFSLIENRKTGSSTASPSEQGSETWNDALRLSIEELEASREELQALNEELKTVNDQLNIRNDEVHEINAELQAKIRELETQSHVLSSGAVMTLFLDEALRIRWFTAAVSELFPVLPTDTGRKITELVPKFDDPYFIDEVRSVMRTAEPLESEVCNRAGRWYLRRIGPFRSGHDKTTGVAITFTDITERKRAEEALRQSEHRLRGFYDSGLLGVIYWNLDGQITDANDKFLEMVGYSREDLKAGRINWRQMTPPEYGPQDDRAMEDLAKGFNVGPFEKEYVRKDGARIPILLAGAMLDEPQRSGVAFALDISDHKRTEAALRESEDRLRFALEISRTGAWDLDLGDHTAHRSLEHDRIFGYDRLLPQWTYGMFLEHVLPEDRAEVEAKFREATASASDWNFECRIRRADGEIRWIWAAGRHYADSSGNLRRMAGIVQDITDRKPSTSQGSAE